MYAGRVVESGTVAEIIDGPRHPYTRGLIDSVPSRNERGRPLHQIPGMTPSLLELAPGCPFRERCERVVAGCTVSPDVSEPLPGRRLRCHNPHAA